MKQRSNILWLDLGDLGTFHKPFSPMDQWQDHGLCLLRTILHNAGILTDLLSVRAHLSWKRLERSMRGYDMLLMNVRSYTFPFAKRAAESFKRLNPSGLVLVGGMHSTVAPQEMVNAGCFDKICQGAGEETIVDLVLNPNKYPRLFHGKGAASMTDWPRMDRTLWPKPPRLSFGGFNYPWPLEPSCGWGPGPVATVLTSRVCPWRCSFCNEQSYIPSMGRRSVDSVIEELNWLDTTYGPLGSVVIHDSMFFQQPKWLNEWLEKYPRKAHKPWPYWAAARADTVRQWPELFERLIKETNWHNVSIGFESGSDRVLGILTKECTAEDNYVAIDLLNRIGDEYVAAGKAPPRFWSNIMLGVPGERKEDAFETMAMLWSMKYVDPSVSTFAPYPGGALGYQIIAEGKSLMSADNYHRNPGDRKVVGVDYDFYDALKRGDYDGEIKKRLRPGTQVRSKRRWSLIKS